LRGSLDAENAEGTKRRFEVEFVTASTLGHDEDLEVKRRHPSRLRRVTAVHGIPTESFRVVQWRSGSWHADCFIVSPTAVNLLYYLLQVQSQFERVHNARMSSCGWLGAFLIALKHTLSSQSSLIR
jgi:hypothetical protein